MKAFIGKPRSGKTRSLIILSWKGQIPIVCRDPDRIKMQALEIGLKIPKPYTYRDFFKDTSAKIYGIENNNQFLFDELVDGISRCYNVQIRGVADSSFYDESKEIKSSPVAPEKLPFIRTALLNIRHVAKKFDEYFAISLIFAFVCFICRLGAVDNSFIADPFLYVLAAVLFVNHQIILLIDVVENRIGLR